MEDIERKSWISFAKKLIGTIQTTFPYADILYSHVREKRIIKDTKEVTVDDSDDKGVKIRIWDGKAFNEFCTSFLDKEYLEEQVHTLMSSIKRRGKTIPRDVKKLNKRFATKPKKDPRVMPLSTKIKKLSSIHTKLVKDDDIAHARVALIEEWEEKIFVSEHRALSQELTNETLITLTYVQTEQGLEQHYQSFFSHGIEHLDLAQSTIREIIKKSKQLKKAKKLTPGKYTCVLSPHLSGLLAHESFGHGMEADTMLKGMCLAKDYLGQKIAGTQVNIVENPSLQGCHGSYFFDDEGELASKTYLMKKGVVHTPISDIYSAHYLRTPKTANGRCERFDHKIYARMSNTYFEPGKDDPKKLIKSVKDGLYLHSAGGGMEDPKGWGIQIQGILAERIQNGKLTGELFTNITMTGYLPTILNNIKMIANDLEVNGTGRCGKQHKEWVRVSEGGPHMLIEEVELG
ncbi:TldD/PmbA family protein [Candidatus Woesearchaeota archaeon]|nr:MAG: TldD/PmbA family protein [Candidatus Woesearchaeota archaeon]